MSDLCCDHACDQCSKLCIVKFAEVLVLKGTTHPIVQGSLVEPLDKTIVNVDEK